MKSVIILQYAIEEIQGEMFMIKKVSMKILRVFILFSLALASGVMVFASQEQEIIEQSSKIESELQEVIDAAGEEEWMSIWVWFKEVEDEKIDELLDGISDYEERLIIIEHAYEEITDAFLEKYFEETDSERIKYYDIYAPTVVVKAVKGEILEYTKDDEIIKISLYKNEPFSEESKAVIIEAKSAARTELRAYKNLMDYREEQQKELQAIMEEGVLEIKHAETVEGIKRILANTERKMDVIKTDQQLTEEETFDNSGKDEVTDTEANSPELKPEDQKPDDNQMESENIENPKVEVSDAEEGAADTEEKLPELKPEEQKPDDNQVESENIENPTEEIPDTQKVLDTEEKFFSVDWMIGLIIVVVCGIFVIRKRK